MADDSYFYSINDFPGDGTQTTFELSFAGGYISKAHITARLIRDLDKTVTDVTFEWVNSFTVKVPLAPPIGYTLRFYRSTPIDKPLVDYSDGALLNEVNLDRANQQAIFAAAESRDAFGTVPANDILRDATTALAFARDRANHTGTQPMTSVAGLAAALADKTPATSKRTGINTLIRSNVDRVLEALPSVFDWEGMGSDDTVRLQRAVAQAGPGILRIPKGAMRTNGIIDFDVAGLTLQLDAGVTLTLNPGKLGTDFSQSNFGNGLRIRADNVSIMGAGSSSLIQNANGSDGNAIGFMFARYGRVSNLVLDGAKLTVDAVEDDSFQSGISCINYVRDNVDKGYAHLLIDGVEIRNWTQYGINVYGNRAADIKILRSLVHDIGRVGGRLSVGAGIVCTRANRLVTISETSIYDCSGHGVFAASAGDPMMGFTVDNCEIFRNGGRGVSITEEAQWGIDPGNAWMEDVTISNNRILDNTGDGIRIGSYDDANPTNSAKVGPCRRGKIIDNTIARNKGFGILAASKDVDGKRCEDWVISRNQIRENGANVAVENGPTGIAVTAACRNVEIYNNQVRDNANGNIRDLQNKTTPITFVNGFASAYPDSFAQPAYWKDALGFVHFTGSVGSGTAGNVAFTLPAGYRPEKTEVFGEQGIWSVAANGQVTMSAGSVWRISSGSFKAASE